jgi:hypothetical protein
VGAGEIAHGTGGAVCADRPGRAGRGDDPGAAAAPGG